MKWLRANKYMINIILLLIGVGVVIFYTFCGDSCSYLQGGLLGIDLQYLGMAYVTVLIVLNIIKKDALILALLSMGIGVEFFLVGYQVAHSTFCPYCLVFAAIIGILFLLNLDLSKKMLILACIAVGFLGLFIFFKGSAFPVYGGTTSSPSALTALMTGWL